MFVSVPTPFLLQLQIAPRHTPACGIMLVCRRPLGHPSPGEVVPWAAAGSRRPSELAGRVLAGREVLLGRKRDQVPATSPLARTPVPHHASPGTDRMTFVGRGDQDLGTASERRLGAHRRRRERSAYTST